MNQHVDPAYFSDVASILLDCGLRPEELPITPRVKVILEKKQLAKAIREATVVLRKQTKREDAKFEGSNSTPSVTTCLTRWAPYMDPWTLA